MNWLYIGLGIGISYLIRSLIVFRATYNLTEIIDSTLAQIRENEEKS